MCKAGQTVTPGKTPSAQTLDVTPGDLIEINRGVYQHWAVSVGGDNVVHLVKEDNASQPRWKRKRCQVMKENLMDVAGKNTWKVNNRDDRSRAPLPVEQIVTEALSAVGEYMTYSLWGYNCEHFSKELRYGEGTSKQVMKIVGGVLIVVAVGLCVIIIGPGTVKAALLKGLTTLFSAVNSLPLSVPLLSCLISKVKQSENHAHAL